MSSLLKENKSPALASGDTAHRFKFIYWFFYFLHVFPVHSLVSAEKPNKLPLQEAAERDRRPLAPQTSSLPLSLCTKLKENQGETRAAFKVWWTAELHAYWWVRPPRAVRGWQPGGHQLSRIKKFGLAAAYTPPNHLVRTQATRNHPESYRSGSRGRCYVHFDHHLISPDAVVTKVRRAELVGCLLCCSQTLCRWAAEQRDTKEKKLQQQTSEAEITYQSLVDSADDLRKCSGPQHWMELCIPPPPPLCLPAPSSLSLSLRLCVCVELKSTHSQTGTRTERWPVKMATGLYCLNISASTSPSTASPPPLLTPLSVSQTLAIVRRTMHVCTVTGVPALRVNEEAG